jgi:hypothetical protein
MSPEDATGLGERVADVWGHVVRPRFDNGRTVGSTFFVRDAVREASRSNLHKPILTCRRD